MSIGSGIGINISKPKKLRNILEYLFGEDQGRYILEVDSEKVKNVEKMLITNNIYYENIGLTQNKYFEIEGEFKINTNDLFKINNQWYNNY